MRMLVVFVEELSAKEMLNVILPKILPDGTAFHVFEFQGKSDLDSQLVLKLREWRLPDTRFLVLRDKDGNDCKKLKADLLKKCDAARRSDVLVRIACHELESFYLGDLDAVSAVYRTEATAQKKRKFRDPDQLANAAEELSKLTHGEYQKVSGSRRIAEHLKMDGQNRSASFNALVSGILKLCGDRP